MPNFRLERVDDELLLFDPAQTKVLYCNDTASLIWELCDGKRTAPEIIALLSETYPDASEAIPGDVNATLRQFHEHGAIEYA